MEMTQTKSQELPLLMEMTQTKSQELPLLMEMTQTKTQDLRSVALDVVAPPLPLQEMSSGLLITSTENVVNSRTIP
jgi:hypothetical protein